MKTERKELEKESDDYDEEGKQRELQDEENRKYW